MNLPLGHSNFRACGLDPRIILSKVFNIQESPLCLKSHGTQITPPAERHLLAQCSSWPRHVACLHRIPEFLLVTLAFLIFAWRTPGYMPCSFLISGKSRSASYSEEETGGWGRNLFCSGPATQGLVTPEWLSSTCATYETMAMSQHPRPHPHVWCVNVPQLMSQPNLDVNHWIRRNSRFVLWDPPQKFWVRGRYLTSELFSAASTLPCPLATSASPSQVSATSASPHDSCPPLVQWAL